MDSKIILNEYIKADIVSDILSQTISATRRKLANENSEETKELLNKLLKYNEEVKKGNVKVMNKILEGEI